MRKFMLTGAVILLAAPVFSQDQAFPPAYTSTDGGSFCSTQFAYSSGRYQIMYGDLYGSLQVYSWKAMQYRRSTTNLGANDGRTFQNVNMQIGKWNMVVTDKWSSNVGSSPTMVFSGSLTLPTTGGTPSSTPAPWGFGAKAGDLQINFTSPILFLSSDGVTVDLTYSGGTLASNTAWTTNRVDYIVDGILAGNMSNVGTSASYGTSTCPAGGAFLNWLHTDRMPPKKSGNNFRTQLYEYGPASEANLAHIGVITTTGLTTPAPFLASCNMLYLDLTQGFVLYPYMTDAAGDHFSDFFVAPFIPPAVGADLWSQAACDIGGKLELTVAGKAIFPALPTANPYTATQYLYAVNGSGNIGGSGFPLGYGPYSGNLCIVKMLQ